MTQIDDTLTSCPLPCVRRSDCDSDDDRPKKPVPDWARGKSLTGQLMQQLHMDPDEVFRQHAKTCTLDEVFAQASICMDST